LVTLAGRRRRLRRRRRQAALLGKSVSGPHTVNHSIFLFCFLKYSLSFSDG
jgi:hypothetical protein